MPNLLTLKLLASRKARMRMLDVIEAMPPEQNRERRWGLERVGRINALEERFIERTVLFTPLAMAMSLVFFSLSLAAIVMTVNLFVLLQWLNPVQAEDVKNRIKKNPPYPQFLICQIYQKSGENHS